MVTDCLTRWLRSKAFRRAEHIFSLLSLIYFLSKLGHMLSPNKHLSHTRQIRHRAAARAKSAPAVLQHTTVDSNFIMAGFGSF
eukprot:g19318.t1